MEFEFYTLVNVCSSEFTKCHTKQLHQSTSVTDRTSITAKKKPTEKSEKRVEDSVLALRLRQPIQLSQIERLSDFGIGLKDSWLSFIATSVNVRRLFAPVMRRFAKQEGVEICRLENNKEIHCWVNPDCESWLGMVLI